MKSTTMRSIEINHIPLSALGDIENIIQHYPFKPYYFLKGISNEEKNALFKIILTKALFYNENILLGVQSNGRYVGFLLLEKQEWDSAFFGFECYRIEHLFAVGELKTQRDTKKILLDHVVQVVQEKKIKYINGKIDTGDISSLYAFSARGFIPQCTMVHFNYFSQKPRKHFKQLGKIRDFKSSDLESLQAIARNSMVYDHFHSDPYFSKESCDTLYATLIENCCKGISADKVFVVEKNGSIAGYVACQVRKDLNSTLPISLGHIRHLAILQPEGFGCGPGLQETALSWLQQRVDCVESAATIQNLPIIRISIRSGMEIVSSYTRVSKWFNI